MPKRTFAQVDPSSPSVPSSSPLKKIHTSTPASQSTASSLFSTPYTPSVYSIPADSPTNPLGLKRRVNNLTLPKPMPFSRHVALRFQLVTSSDAPPPKPSLWLTPGSSSPSPSDSVVHSKNPLATQYASEGTYRIVQAPLSYTFRHLRALIVFLFSGDPATWPSVPGHLFAVHHGISISAQGEITRGRVRVKLSRARDPYYSSRSLADIIAAADAQGQGEDDLEDEEEDASWKWEGEDDFTLGHVWDVRSRDPKRGIIYHYDDTTAIHITLNSQTVPHRKGVGNMPFVFRAYGVFPLDLSRPSSHSSSPTELPHTLPAPLPPPPRIFPSYKHLTPTNTKKAASGDIKPLALEGPGDTDVDDELSSDEDDFDGGLDTRVWNHTGAFRRFLTIVRTSARSSSSSSSSSPSPSPSAPPSPSLVRTTISSSSPTRKRSIFRASTMPYASGGSTSSAVSLSLSLPSCSNNITSHPSSSPARSLPSLTPAPARVRTRYRVARTARRLLGLAERGLESAAAEEAEGVDGRVQGQSKKGHKGNGKKEKARSEKDIGRARPKTKAKTKTLTGDADEVWNPFANLKDA